SSAKRPGSTQTSIMNFMSSPILVVLTPSRRTGAAQRTAPRSSRRNGHDRQVMRLRDQGKQDGGVGPRQRSRGDRAPPRVNLLRQRAEPGRVRGKPGQRLRGHPLVARLGIEQGEERGL